MQHFAKYSLLAVVALHGCIGSNEATGDRSHQRPLAELLSSAVAQETIHKDLRKTLIELSKRAAEDVDLTAWLGFVMIWNGVGTRPGLPYLKRMGVSNPEKLLRGETLQPVILRHQLRRLRGQAVVSAYIARCAGRPGELDVRLRIRVELDAPIDLATEGIPQSLPQTVTRSIRSMGEKGLLRDAKPLDEMRLHGFTIVFTDPMGTFGSRWTTRQYPGFRCFLRLTELGQRLECETVLHTQLLPHRDTLYGEDILDAFEPRHDARIVDGPSYYKWWADDRW